MTRSEEWNRIEERIREREEFPRPKRRQVWWCSIGLNIGSEQSCNEGYERPVLVVGVWGAIFWGIPITSSDPDGKKDENPLFYKIEGIPYKTSDGRLKHLEGYLALHQLRAYDARRLQRKILKMELGLFEVIRTQIKAMF